MEINVFTEGSLSDSVIYQSFNNNAEMTTNIITAIRNSITITDEYIQEQLLQIKRTKISPLSEQVLKAYEDGNIVLLYSKTSKVSTAIPFFATKMKGKIKVFIFVNNYGTMSKSSINSEDKFLNITMKDLYVLMEGAFVSYQYALFPNNVTKNLGLMKTSCSIYMSMILRILNKEYAISMDQDIYSKIAFSIGYFFLKNVWMSKNYSVNVTYACTCIKNAVNRAEMITVAENMDELNVNTIKDLIVFIKDMTPRLASLNFRYFLQCYINIYKRGAMFSLECLPYFLYTIEATLIGSFLVNQPIISDIVKNIKGMNTFYPELVKSVS